MLASALMVEENPALVPKVNPEGTILLCCDHTPFIRLNTQTAPFPKSSPIPEDSRVLPSALRLTEEPNSAEPNTLDGTSLLP